MGCVFWESLPTSTQVRALFYRIKSPFLREPLACNPRLALLSPRDWGEGGRKEGIPGMGGRMGGWEDGVTVPDCL